MNNFNNTLYIDTDNNAKYLELIIQLKLPDLLIVDDPLLASIALVSPPLLSAKISQFAKLEWAQSIYAGVDTLSKHSTEIDFTVTNVKGIFGQQISEYVIGYSLEYYRHFLQYKEQQNSNEWSPIPYTTLDNKCMLVLGTGSIGNHVAKTAKALGLNVIGVNRSGIPPKDSNFDETYHIQELTVSLSKADIIVSTLPNTPDTQYLLNEKTLSHCKNALLFNVGRGTSIDEKGLLIALSKGFLSHAYLDVFIQEPLDVKHPYWNHPQITITPHIAAVSFPEQVIEQFKSNYMNWISGFNLENVVDLNKGY